MNEQSMHSNSMTGLSSNEVIALQRQHGKNIFSSKKEFRFLNITWDIIREPMFIMLMIACSLYFVLNEISEGIMMAVAMVIVAGISFYQEVKSSRAIHALKQLTEPKIPVIRNAEEILLPTEELVPGDIILLEEGMRIPADAIIIQQNDLSVDESIITGESMPLYKGIAKGQNILYQGSVINSGKCIARVTTTGNQTFLGKIGKSISDYSNARTLLQKQVNKFVRSLAIFGLVAFIIIFAINYLHYGEFATSLLFALTLAMSAVPEEIPVAFSSFMALGTLRVSKKNVIIRQPQVIENLGAINVLCLDKTGTITENKMEVKELYSHDGTIAVEMDRDIPLSENHKRTLLYATLASEINPFDPMEKAIWDAYRIFCPNGNVEEMKMIHEYPLQGHPPMMTHVYMYNHSKLVAAKGAAERIMEVCGLSIEQRNNIIVHATEMAEKGYRVLGVASSEMDGPELPATQDEFNWKFEGLLALYDPPRKNVDEVIRKIYDADVNVKLLTGDFPETAITIARLAGIKDALHYCTGREVMSLSDEDLQVKAKTTNMFVRMYPDAKLKLINAIKANGDTVAMTGDGVNDGPALKAADIGIAMGNKGTEIARQAADIVLTDDDLGKIPFAVIEGRKIFNNLVKAIRYIIAIHIPIILTASVPLILGWKYPNIFTPIHVIFLELIMGPTCSIFFEREPIEDNDVLKSPRNRYAGLLNRKDLLFSISQGILIAFGVMTLYYIYMNNGHSVEETRTIVFTTLIISNIFLTFSSRSFTQTIFQTIRYKNPLAPVVLVFSIAFLAVLHLVPDVQELFKLAHISFSDFLVCTGAAFASVMWFEIYKSSLFTGKNL